MPVYEEDIDQILGIVHIKELLRAQARGQAAELRDFLHPAHFVPDSMPISHLLKELQEQRTHMALVIDEFGTIIGLVTTEDLLEEIVGEIHDEFDGEEEQPIQELSPGIVVVDGGITLSEFTSTTTCRSKKHPRIGRWRVSCWHGLDAFRTKARPCSTRTIG